MRVLGVAWLTTGALLAGHRTAEAQEHAHGDDGASLRVSAQAVLLGTHVTPGINGDTRTEGYVSQPVVMLHARLPRGFELIGALNLEGLTLARGELSPGSWGEGYVDRRHPHTYLHEAVAVWSAGRGTGRGSLAVGKGFAPFGTDDPMGRPFAKFPINHHLAQILERLVAIGAVRYRGVLLEAALFNGEEPSDARDMPNLSRFGDSWSGRATVYPLAGMEAQVSRAWVESAEQPRGDGLDQRKWSASVRYARGVAGGSLYVLGEWAHTEELQNDRFAFELPSLLLETSWERGGWRGALRAERTERTEEERLADPYRAPWPHADIRPIGRTRWTTTSAALQKQMQLGRIQVAPFVEGSYSRVEDTVERAVFVARDHFGSDRIRSVSIGARLATDPPHRMGRYGAARDITH